VTSSHQVGPVLVWICQSCQVIWSSRIYQTRSEVESSLVYPVPTLTVRRLHRLADHRGRVSRPNSLAYGGCGTIDQRTPDLASVLPYELQLLTIQLGIIINIIAL
jgi:hypothetical protein